MRQGMNASAMSNDINIWERTSIGHIKRRLEFRIENGNKKLKLESDGKFRFGYMMQRMVRPLPNKLNFKDYSNGSMDLPYSF